MTDTYMTVGDVKSMLDDYSDDTKIMIAYQSPTSTNEFLVHLETIIDRNGYPLIIHASRKIYND